MKINLGPKEIQVISRLSYDKTRVVTKEYLEDIFGKDILVRQIIFQLKSKGILIPITRGVYYYSPLEAGPSGSRMNEFLIPPLLFPNDNYYIGYSNMYNYYGFTDQIFQTYYVLNTSRQRKREICGTVFNMVKVPYERMYGLRKIKISDSEIIVSDRERTLVDLIYFPNPVGGIKNAFKILEKQVSSDKIDIRKFLKYTLLFPSVSTRKRIGYLLDNAGVSEKILVRLFNNIKNTSLITLYGSKSRKGTIVNKWKVIIDD